ncbi:acyl carrier protein, partial [Roseibium sp. RKSG952]|uniref:acyl carrier protein n=1 Tax=Roseibium sp. RKSG952 TaxID=2529384 RepID=UPI0012BC53E1
GGHSLLAVKLLSQIQLHLNITMNIKDVFKLQTVKEISEHVEILYIPVPSEQAILLLRANPTYAHYFDSVYGLNASEKYLRKKENE